MLINKNHDRYRPIIGIIFILIGISGLALLIFAWGHFNLHHNLLFLLLDVVPQLVLGSYLLVTALKSRQPSDTEKTN